MTTKPESNLTPPTSFKWDADIFDIYQSQAVALDRPTAWLTRKALREYAAAQGWLEEEKPETPKPPE